MSNSPLATMRVNANPGNYTKGRSKKIRTICIHHMAGVLSAAVCGGIFQKAGRGASSNYGIGKNGEIAIYVDECNTSWCNSNWNSNCESVTIETSNCEVGGQWKVSDKVLGQLIVLVADIAKRNNLGTLVKGDNVVWHSMFKDTNCPGPYLMSKMDYIISEANRINTIQEAEEEPKPISSGSYKIGDVVNINGVYISSTSERMLRPLIKKGTITKIIPGARNPYLLNKGLIGWVNDNCIVKDEDTIYIVRKGDTLSGIASRYNTTWQKIYNDNKDVIGDNPNLIKPNQRLKIK